MRTNIHTSRASPWLSFPQEHEKEKKKKSLYGLATANKYSKDDSKENRSFHVPGIIDVSFYDGLCGCWNRFNQLGYVDLRNIKMRLLAMSLAVKIQRNCDL